MIDISNIPRNNKTYNGNYEKYGVTINNVDYIVKFSKEDDMSVYSEYIASSLIRRLGIPCHEVHLAVCKGTVVDLIKDFTSNTNTSLHSFKDIKQSSEDTEINNKEYTYDDVLYLIDRHLKMSENDKQDAKRQFWNMFICDAIIGNKDRHWGNWGYLKIGGNYKFAPLYDNGGGLYPGVNDVIEQYININTRRKFIHDRVYVFPASLLKIKRTDRAYRSNYNEILGDLRFNRILAEQVRQIRSAVSYGYVFDSMVSISSSLPLPVWYRRFYIEIATMRYMCLILRIDFDKAYQGLERGLNGYT